MTFANRSNINLVGDSTAASNLGNGSGLFASKSGVTLNFKSISGGTNVSIVTGDTTLTISILSGVTSAINGLTQSGNIIKFGGTLCETTTINGSNGTYDLWLGGNPSTSYLNNFYVRTKNSLNLPSSSIIKLFKQIV